MKKKLVLALCLAALATTASARNAEDYWCGKGKDRIHLMMWIAKVQEPMRDDEGKLIRDDKGNLTWGRAADGRTYEQYGIINHKLPENHPKWVTVVPNGWIRFDTEDNIYFRGQKCTVFTEKDQDKYGVGYYGPRWDLRFPLSKENWSEPSCARVSDKLPVEPDGSYLNLRDGPGTEFKVKVKLPAGTDLNLDGASQDGKWKHVRSAVINEENYSGWVREKFVLDQPCKTSKTSDTGKLLPPPFGPYPDPAPTDEQAVKCLKPDGTEESCASRQSFFELTKRYDAEGLEKLLPPPFGPTDKTFLGREQGGRIDQHIERWKALAASGDDIEIRDFCYSACTLVTAYIPKERLCFSVSATLAFHLARFPNGEPSMEVSRWMFNAYPEDIRAWLRAKGGLEKMPLQGFWLMFPSELWQMGYRNCGDLNKLPEGMSGTIWYRLTPPTNPSGAAE